MGSIKTSELLYQAASYQADLERGFTTLALDVLKSAYGGFVGDTGLIWSAWRVVCDVDQPRGRGADREEAGRYLAAYILGCSIEKILISVGEDGEDLFFNATDGLYIVDLSAKTKVGLWHPKKR